VSVAALSRVHPESVAFFTTTARKPVEEQGASALAAALAQMSGFCKPPSYLSLGFFLTFILHLPMELEKYI